MKKSSIKYLTILLLGFSSLILIFILSYKARTDWLADYFEGSYTVVMGDSYASIAKNQLGSLKKIKVLQDLNNGAALKIGQILKLPAQKRWNELFD